MNAFKNLRIGTRLSLMLGCVLMIMCGVAGVGIWGLGDLYGIATRVLAQDVRLAQQAADLQNLVLQERRFEKDAFINLADADRLAEYVRKWQGVRTRIGSSIDDATRLELNAEDVAALQDIARHFKAYADGFEATLAGIAGGQIKTTQQANAELGKVKASVHGMESASDAMSNRAAARAAQVGAQIEAVRSHARTLQLALTAAGLLLAAVLGWLATRSMSLML